MALEYFTGFEIQDTAEFIGTTGTVAYSTSTVRTAGGASLRCTPVTTGLGGARVPIQLNANGRALNNANWGTTELYISLHIYMVDSPSSEEQIAFFGNTSNENLEIRAIDSGSGFVLRAYDGQSTPAQIGSDSSEFTLNAWHHLLLHFPLGISNSGRTFALDVDGTEEITGSSLNLGSGTVADQILVGKYNNLNGAGYDCYYDDFSAWSGNGYEPDGDEIIEIAVPTGNGTYTDFTGDYTDVDDLPNDGATTETTTVAASDQETYTYPDIVSTGDTIHGFQVVGIGNRDTAGEDGGVMLRSSTTDSLGNTATDFLGAYNTSHLITEVDPATASAWTVSAANSAECGVHESGASGGKVSWTGVYKTIMYTPAPPAGGGLPAGSLLHRNQMRHALVR